MPASHHAPDFLDARVSERMTSMSPVCRKVASYMNAHRAAVLASSATELAERIGTSDASVIRTAQTLGFTGLGELKQALVAAVEQPSPLAETMRKTLHEVGDDSGRAVSEVLHAHADAMKRLRQPATRAKIVAAVAALHAAQRIALFGIGPSAALADYAGMLLARAGRRTLMLTATGAMLADQMLDLRPDDAMLVLAYGRAYPEVVAVFAEAQRLGMELVLVTDSLEQKLAQVATVVLPAGRGRAERVALHGATVVCLEALILGLAAADKAAALATLAKLSRLRGVIRAT